MPATIRLRDRILVPRPLPRRGGLEGLVLCAMLVVAPSPRAQAPDQLAQSSSLADLTLEQLSNVLVTSVARRSQTLAEAAASIYVITSDEIRRSGVRTLPEALRLAPNLQVARADANQYAITARGFGNVLANKLLVLIDGRTVYSPLFSGVFWEAQNVVLEDVDRIEVIDGPNGTLWGTNAVNGVINIITKSASATQGTLLAGGGGNDGYTASARYGGTMQNGGHWRIYANTVGNEPTERANGPSVEDRSQSAQGGFRADWQSGADAYTVQGDAYHAGIDQGPTTRKIGGVNLLGRWRRDWSDGAGLTVQAYYDHTEREHPGTFRELLDTLDLEAQAMWRLAERHLLTVGGGYRFQNDRVTNFAAQAFLPPERSLDTGYVFAQDEYTIMDDLAFIGGVKFEYNDYTGVETLPNVRLKWNVTPTQLVWAAISRAVRAPSRIDRELRIPANPPLVLRENSDFGSEVVMVYEAGLRGQPSARVSYSLTAFHNDYDRLRSQQPSPLGGLQFANGIEGRTNGIEGWGTWHPFDSWRLFAGATRLWQDLSVKPGDIDIGGIPALGNDPKFTWQLRSSLDITPAHEFDVLVRHVGARPQPAVPAYTAVDLRLGWKVTPQLEVSLLFQNLADPGHPEWGPATNRVEFDRGWYAKLVYRL